MYIATESKLIYPRIYIIGDPGSGKTYLAGLIHEMLKKYAGTKGGFLGNFDKGHQTLRTFGFDMTVEDYIDININSPSAWDRFCKDTDKLLAEKPEEYAGFKMIVGDSFTTMQSALMRDIVRTNVLKDRRYYRLMGLTTINDFGVFERAVTEQFFTEYFKMCEKMITVLICHTSLMPGEEGQPPRIMPRIKGQAIAGNVIVMYFNEAVMCKVVGTGSNAVRRIQTSKDMQVDLKSQVKGMPSECSFEEYVFRIGVAYGFLKGDAINKYVSDKKLDLSKMKDWNV